MADRLDFERLRGFDFLAALSPAVNIQTSTYGKVISALYGFTCPVWAFRGLLDKYLLGGSTIKIKSYQFKSKAFHIFLPNVDP